MEYIKDGKNYFIRLERGEELIASLESFMKKENLGSAFLKGLGALEKVELGYYDLPKKTYLRKRFPEEAELLSAVGNLTFKDGNPFAHVHVVLSGEDFKAYGGHLFEAYVSVTVEIFVEVMDCKLERKMHDDVGLQLVSCKCV